MALEFVNNSIFWIEIDKIKPNPYQPRKEFDEAKLRDLSESIRMYGILQPLVVTRKEVVKEDGGLQAEYELISGERRLRASKLANLVQVPVLIRNGEEDNRVKLELAIIENLQREDINVVDRARAFDKLAKEFNLTHNKIGEKVGKSREYVSNTLRILNLSEAMLSALSLGKMSEGHTRPLLMLGTRPEEQETLFKEILFKKMSVRDAELIARKIAQDRARKKEKIVDPEMMFYEKELAETLGTRVQVERTGKGCKMTVDFFSSDDLKSIFYLIKQQKEKLNILDKNIEKSGGINLPKMPQEILDPSTKESLDKLLNYEIPVGKDGVLKEEELVPEKAIDDRSKDEKKEDEEDLELYDIKNFSL